MRTESGLYPNNKLYLNLSRLSWTNDTTPYHSDSILVANDILQEYSQKI